MGLGVDGFALGVDERRRGHRGPTSVRATMRHGPTLRRELRQETWPRPPEAEYSVSRSMGSFRTFASMFGLLCFRATHSLLTVVDTGVLWVSTRVTPPSRQDGGNVRAPALARAVCVVVQVVAVARVRR